MKMLRKGLINVTAFILTIVLSIPTLYAQTVSPNVRVNTNDYHRISIDGGGKSIAVVNDTVYAVWQGEPTDSTSNIYFSKSIDGGETFLLESNIFSGPDSILHMFPSLFVAQTGNIYVSWSAASNNQANMNVWLSKSTNGGVTFQAPVHITNDNSSVFPSIGAYGSNVYVFYADAANYPMADYYFARSTNNGDSFENPIQVNDAPSTSSIEFDRINRLSIDQSGNIYLAWVDGRRANGNGDIFFAKSTDSGQSFSTNVMVNDVNELGADSIQHNPSITVDNSNNIYVSFTDKRLGSDWPNDRVYMTKSSDGGSSFDTESLLAGHDDACKNHDISTNASGKLSAAMCTHVAPNWGTWLVESTDGGNNFATPVALNDAPGLDFSEVQIVLKPDNEVCAIWKDNRVEPQNIYFAKTDLAISVSDLDIDNEYVLYPNPTNGSVSLKIPNNSTTIEVTIFNLQGQLIYRESYSNTSKISLELEMSTGLYFVTIKSHNELKTLKLINLSSINNLKK